MSSGLIRHLALSMFGATTARLLIFLMLPIAARVYTKDDFGGLALVVGFVGLVQPLLTLRYEVAIVLPRSDSVARTIIHGLCGTAAVGCCLIALLVALAPDFLAPVADPVLMSELRIPVLIHLAAMLVTVTLTAWLQRKGRFRVVALSQMLGSLMTAVVVLGAPALITPTLVVLYSGYVVGAVTSAAVVIDGSIKSHLLDHRSTRTFRRVSSIMSKYRVYPIFSLPLSLSALVADRTLLLYLSTAFSLATLGGFFSIRQLLLGLVHLVTATVSQVIYAYAARSAQKVASLSAPLLTLAGGIAVSAGFGLGWVTVSSIELTRVLLGADWLDTARMVPWIAAQGAVVAVVGWQGRLLDVERRQRLDAALQIAGDATTLTAIACLWFAAVSEIPAIATICVIGALHGVVWLIVVYHVTGIGVAPALTVLIKLTGATAAAALWTFAARSALGPLAGSLVSLALTIVAVLAVTTMTVRRLDRQVRETDFFSIR